jgi:hypothetical protein
MQRNSYVEKNLKDLAMFTDPNTHLYHQKHINTTIISDEVYG